VTDSYRADAGRKPHHEEGGGRPLPAPLPRRFRPGWPAGAAGLPFAAAPAFGAGGAAPGNCTSAPSRKRSAPSVTTISPTFKPDATATRFEDSTLVLADLSGANLEHAIFFQANLWHVYGASCDKSYDRSPRWIDQLLLPPPVRPFRSELLNRG